jgi:uncharacterized protein YukE
VSSSGRQPPPRLSGSASAATIRVDDPRSLSDTAGAFSQALEAVEQARTQFAGAASRVGKDLGDATLSVRYKEVFQRSLGALDAIGHCFDELFRALSSASSGYEDTDTSVAGRMR